MEIGPLRWRKRSLAWSHFILMEGKEESAQCKKCGVVLRVTKAAPPASSSICGWPMASMDLEAINFIMLRSSVMDFVGLLDTPTLPPTNRRWELVREKYEALKGLSSLLNDLCGLTEACSLTVGIVFYTLSFHELSVAGASNWLGLVWLSFYLGNTIVTLGLSADVPQKMQTFRAWLAVDENRVALSGEELSFLLDELNCNVISIKAWNNFPITYPLFSSIFGLTLTYFFVCVS